ncbi:hypothetical protein D3C76_1481540 [compost metagenome]
MGCITHVLAEAAIQVFAGLPVAVEQDQMCGDAFEQQALVENEGVKPLFVAVADEHRHRGCPP